MAIMRLEPGVSTACARDAEVSTMVSTHEKLISHPVESIEGACAVGVGPPVLRLECSSVCVAVL